MVGRHCVDNQLPLTAVTENDVDRVSVELELVLICLVGNTDIEAIIPRDCESSHLSHGDCVTMASQSVQ